jgi:ribosome-binding factor A
MPHSSRRPARPSGRTAHAHAADVPTQRQLRAGELVRHALIEILREEALADPSVANVSVTLTEVRMSPDLRHALAFVMPLGGAHTPEVVAALNRGSKFLRGKLGRSVDLRFTPDLKFVADESFDAAERMSRLFDDPKVRRDLAAGDEGEPGDGA